MNLTRHCLKAYVTTKIWIQGVQPLVWRPFVPTVTIVHLSGNVLGLSRFDAIKPVCGTGMLGWCEKTSCSSHKLLHTAYLFIYLAVKPWLWSE